MKIKKNNKKLTYEDFFNGILDDIEAIEEKEEQLYPNGDEDLKKLTLEEKVNYLMDAVKKINGILMINNRAIELFINDLDNIHSDTQDAISLALKTQLIFTASINVIVNKLIESEALTQDEYVKELYSSLKTAAEIYEEEGYDVNIPDIVSQYTEKPEKKKKKTDKKNVVHFVKFKKDKKDEEDDEE